MDSFADHIVALVVQHTGAERFKELISVVFKEHGGIDLATYQPQNFSATLWEQFGKQQKIRNAIVHRAEQADRNNAERAIQTVTVLIETVFPQIVNSLGFHLHGARLCEKYECSPAHLNSRKQIKEFAESLPKSGQQNDNAKNDQSKR